MRKKEFIFILFLIICFFGACSTKKIDLNTTLTFDENGSGERIMQFCISKAEYETYFGDDIHTLNEIAGLGCPKNMTMDFSEDDGTYQYSFKIVFSSLENYKEKVSEILGREVEINFEQSNAVFEVGINYNEDFTSEDLMQWLKTLLLDKGYFTQDNLKNVFTSGTSSLSYKEQTYECEGMQYTITSLIKTPLIGVDVLTTFRNSDRYDRKYVFKFSHSAVDQFGEEFKNYMTQTLGDQIEPVWEEQVEAVTCTIELKDASWMDQQTLLKKLFDSTNSRIYVEDAKIKKMGYFSFGNKWSETIDASNLVESSEDTIPLAYYVQAEEGVSLQASLPNEKGDYQLKDTDVYGGYQLAYEGDVNHWSIECTAKHTYVISDILVNTKVKNAEDVKRSIYFVFEDNPSEEEQKTLIERMEGLCEDLASVSSLEDDNKFQITVELEGSMEQLNESFGTIFGQESNLQCEEKGKLREWKHQCTYVDRIDFSKFIKNDENKTTLQYSLKLNTGEEINTDSISSTVNLKKGEQSIDGNTYTCSVNGFYLNVTLSSQKWNQALFTLLKAILLLVLLIVAMIVITIFVKKVTAYRQNF